MALERFAESKDGHVIPLRIAAGYKRSLMQDLRILGVSESTLFPDLDGLARDIRQLFDAERNDIPFVFGPD